MSYPDQENDLIVSTIIDYLSEALVLNEMSQQEYDYLCAHLSEGADWLYRNKGIDIDKMV